MTDAYMPFYQNLEGFANEGEENHLTVKQILQRLDVCDRHLVTDPRFNSRNDDRPRKCICGVSITDTYPFSISGKERKEKYLFVGSKCIERVMGDNVPTSLDFEQSLFNRCCYEGCGGLIRKRTVKHKILLHFCPEHHKGYSKFRCSGCPTWAPWNSGRPTHAYCPACVKKYKQLVAKNYCAYCSCKLKNTNFKQCYSCFKKTYKKCNKCEKQFDSHMGTYEICFRCNFNMPDNTQGVIGDSMSPTT